MDNLGGVDVFESSEELVEEKLIVLLCERLIAPQSWILCLWQRPRYRKPLARLHRVNLTHIDDLIAIEDFESLFGDGGDLPLGVVVPVGFVHVDDVFS